MERLGAMGYQVLARKYRPQRFADVAGQDHVTRTLVNALSQNRVAHGYIFSGHRGIGKTTVARILAMALNCRTQAGSAERPTVEPCLRCVSCREISSGGSAESGNEAMHSFDFIEIDAASNRGIDDVRSIRTEATVQPARDKYKIFLLDEAHQITDAAFNAILKTLEEPPEWSIFMMATTQPEDIPQTIRSRCQHFSFHAVKFDDILAQLKAISAAEHVEAEDAALALLAEAGDGSMRDALSIMDQAIASAPLEEGRAVLSAAQIRELMGTVPNAVFERLLEAVARGQSAELMEQLNVLLNAGHGPQSLARQMVRYLRNALMAKLGGEQTELLEISADERARATRTAMLFNEEELTRNLQIVLRAFDDLNYRQEQRFHLELALLKLVHAQRLLPIEELLSGVAPGGGAKVAQGRPADAGAAPARPTAQGQQAQSGAAGGPKRPAAISKGREAAAFAPEVTRAESPKNGSATVTAIAAEPEVGAADVRDVVPAQAAAGDLPGANEQTAGEAAMGGVANAETLRDVVCGALERAGHSTAAQLLGAGNWLIDGSMVRIETAAMGKKMLSLTINAAAEKLIREALTEQGGPARFLVVPGETGGMGQPAAPIATKGSVQEAALGNPLVQRAREIFHAEIRSVVDLREK